MTKERKTAEQIAANHFEQGWSLTELADAIEKALVELAQRKEGEKS